MKVVRCAIYTRKSSDEGLEQGFNSLDAQREACATYVLSQASEGWVALPDIYDDGGISGGTLERPALQRLLADIEAGRIDIVVVYKVDRLTRSLLDFSKLVEAFDKAGASFVSVTQSFNTTTSMGRLTLNMLLSFAQFEREVTAERIRDKIAASKAKGMWMGGTVPLGYRADGRSLAIVDEHADVVRGIYARYLALGSVRALADTHDAEGVYMPKRTRIDGNALGGGRWSRGHLYALLKCRTYVGDIDHRGTIYPGLHNAIIDRELFARVQTMLAEHQQRVRIKRSQSSVYPLREKLTDEAGAPLIGVHAVKKNVRYRYYVSRAAHHREPGADKALRIPAREIEALIVERVAQSLADPLAHWPSVAGRAPGALVSIMSHTSALSRRIADADAEAALALVESVQLTGHGVLVRLSAEALGPAAALCSDGPITLDIEARLTRTGDILRLVPNDGRSAAAALAPDPAMVRIVTKAHDYWRTLSAGDIDVTRLAAREGVTPGYVTRIVRLAFLSPSVIEAILAGKQRAAVDVAMLTAPGAVTQHWDVQERQLLIGGTAR